MKAEEIQELHKRLGWDTFKDGKGDLITICPLEMELTADQAVKNILGCRKPRCVPEDLQAVGIRSVGVYLAALDYNAGKDIFLAAIKGE